MKIQLLIPVLLLALYCHSSFAQISFEKGYFINNEDQRTECLIKNEDWNLTPTKFQYQLTGGGELNNTTNESVKEFGIYNISKFIRYTVNIDRSSDSKNELSTVRPPQFNKEQLFLKVLVEGKATLYEYKDLSVLRYFYKTDSSVEQLIYKKYIIKETEIYENTSYKQQLLNTLSCPDISQKSIENTDYDNNGLVKHFIKYNQCYKSEFTTFDKKNERDLFNLSIRPGINYSNALIANPNVQNSKTDFDNKISIRLGVELEFVLPVKNNKWAAVIEPTYQYYKSEQIVNTSTRSIDYKSIELPIGLRHSFFLSKNSKIFINAYYVLDFSFDSKIDYNSFTVLDIDSGYNYALGMGFKHKKYGVEFRYASERGLLGGYSNWNSKYNNASVIFGFALF